MQNHLSGPLLDLSRGVRGVLVLESPQLDSVLQMLSHNCWIEGNNHFPWAAGCCGSDTHMHLAFLAWAVAGSHSACPLRSLCPFMPSCFSASRSPDLSWCVGLLHLKVQDFAFCFADLHALEFIFFYRLNAFYLFSTVSFNYFGPCYCSFCVSFYLHSWGGFFSSSELFF